MSDNRFWLWAAACALAGWCSVASAQTFYKWTDERGVVHFSDSPPPNTKNVEERNLPAPVAGQPQPAESTEKADTAETRATPGKPATGGPARVILVSRQTPRVGPSAMHIIGAVKNVGGADARRVSITISAVDVTQGNPCLNEDAPVTPSTLHSGETGNFDAEVDSPCLYGEPDVDITPVWE